MLREEASMLASSPAKTNPPSSSFIAAFRDWVRQRKLLRQCRRRLDACDKSELARIARDVGISSADLRQMSERGPGAAKLLLDRMAVLHLDADALAKNDPTTTRDMQRLCSSCVAKKRCQRDLLLTPDDPMWREYCPNAGTLGELQSEAANAR
jgi:hypothetical protein